MTDFCQCCDHYLVALEADPLIVVFKTPNSCQVELGLAQPLFRQRRLRIWAAEIAGVTSECNKFVQTHNYIRHVDLYGAKSSPSAYQFT